MTISFLVDTDILSLFAKTEAIQILLRLFGAERLPITPGVFSELLAPLDYGYDFPHQVFANSTVVSLSLTELELYAQLRLEGNVSSADAEQIAVCHTRAWVYVTMDRVAARIAASHQVHTVDLYALFKALRKGEVLTDDTLYKLILRMEHLDRTKFPFRDEFFSP